MYDLQLSRDTLREINDTLKSGWLSTGPKVIEFEAALARYDGVKYAAAVSSATAGMLLTLEAMDMAGKDVITTPYSFVATTEAIQRAGATPVYVDIDPVTLAIDPSQVESRLSRRTGCILPVDVAGVPSDYAALRRLARQAEVPILADASHALGARYRGKSIPRMADVAVYSFHATKNLTCGEGGMVMTRRKRLAERVKLLSLHGLTKSAYERRRKGQWAYDVTALGYKANMSEMQAAMGLGNLRQFEKNQAKRKKAARRYIENLHELSDYLELPVCPPGSESAWHLFIIKLRLERLSITRDQFIGKMAGHGVECGVHYIPIYEFSFYRDLGLRPSFFPVTDDVARRVVTLPLYPGLKSVQVDQVCEAVRAIARRFGR